VLLLAQGRFVSPLCPPRRWQLSARQQPPATATGCSANNQSSSAALPFPVSLGEFRHMARFLLVSIVGLLSAALSYASSYNVTAGDSTWVLAVQTCSGATVHTLHG
jgi:hypothetical protein